MIRSDQLVLAVVGLAALDVLLAVQGVSRQLIWPIHPVDAGVNVVLIAGADLEDARDPIVVRVRPRPHRLVVGTSLLPLDGALVCDKDVIVAKIL